MKHCVSSCRTWKSYTCWMNPCLFKMGFDVLLWPHTHGGFSTSLPVLAKPNQALTTASSRQKTATLSLNSDLLRVGKQQIVAGLFKRKGRNAQVSRDFLLFKMCFNENQNNFSPSAPRCSQLASVRTLRGGGLGLTACYRWRFQALILSSATSWEFGLSETLINLTAHFL